MRLLDKLERRFSRWAIPNVTMILVAGQVVAYALMWTRPQHELDLYLIANRVLQGEVWRLLSFLFTPPDTNPLFAFFFWSFFYLMGTVLENTWGTLRYNIYLLIGWAGTIAASFLAPDMPASFFYLETSVFLAFAWLYPDFVIRMFFIIPVKAKWVAAITWIYYLYVFLVGPLLSQLLIAASIANFILFFGGDLWRRARHGRRHMAEQAERIRMRHQARHRCRVCGITEKSHPDEDFRYCSKCEGNQCYCSAHLRDHEHVTNDMPASRS
jgi:hypothetical protein